MNKQNEATVETTFTDEATEKQEIKMIKQPGKVKGFIKRNWKKAALMALAAAAGYAVGKKSGTSGDGEEATVETSTEDMETD